MITNKRGDKLYSLLPKWNKVLTARDLRNRKTSSEIGKTRQALRAYLWKSAFASVNKADAKRCQKRGEIAQTRKERRNLARAYFKAAQLSR